MVSMASSIITTTFVQKVKETFSFKKSNRLILVCFISSMIFGILFALSFSDLRLINTPWVGLISFIGADTIYKMFEDRIFTPYKDINKNKMVKIPIENEIK